MKKKISAIYVKYVPVLGDEIINDTACFLFKDICHNVEIQSFGLLPEPENFKKLLDFESKLNKLFLCLEYKLNFSQNFSKNLIFILKFLYWKKCKPEQHYKEITQDTDAVIFCGGGIFQQFYMNMWAGIFSIVQDCARKNIPVYFNAIGLEKPETLAEHLLYKYILNQKVIKSVTTRDNIEYLLELRKSPAKILDPALWAEECYKIKKKNSDTIGLGVIRPKIFFDNHAGNNLNYDKILNLYIGIIKELEKRGYNWQLFSNGGETDYNFGVEILEKLNLSAEYLAPYPKSTKALVEQIATYKGVIAARLHSNIVATALGIPATGIVWAKKSLRFAEFMKFDWNYITPEYFSSPDYIINQLEKSLQNGVNIEHLNQLKKQSYDIMQGILYDKMNLV